MPDECWSGCEWRVVLEGTHRMRRAKQSSRLLFNRSLSVNLRGARLTSDRGSNLMCEPDDSNGLVEQLGVNQLGAS